MCVAHTLGLQTGTVYGLCVDTDYWKLCVAFAVENISQTVR